MSKHKINPLGCHATVEIGFWDRSNQCRISATIEEDGHRWCWMHAPSVIAIKKADKLYKNIKKNNV